MKCIRIFHYKLGATTETKNKVHRLRILRDWNLIFSLGLWAVLIHFYQNNWYINFCPNLVIQISFVTCHFQHELVIMHSQPDVPMHHFGLLIAMCTCTKLIYQHLFYFILLSIGLIQSRLVYKSIHFGIFYRKVMVIYRNIYYLYRKN